MIELTPIPQLMAMLPIGAVLNRAGVSEARVA
jgi:hypothetical protein